MSDFLMRDAAPIGEDTWAKVDEMVVDVLKKNLVGRRFIKMVGPLGWGVEQAPQVGFEGGAAFVASAKTEYVEMVELAQSFILRGKHLATATQTPFGLDLGAVAMAATALAKAENAYLLGTLQERAGSAALGDWDSIGGPFKAIAEATAKLRAAGFDAPYALITSPLLYARLAGLVQHGRREIDMVEKLAQAGIYQWLDMADDEALVVSTGPWNLDMVVGQDAVTAYSGNEGLDQSFSIFETLVLRVKRPGCVLKLS